MKTIISFECEEQENDFEMLLLVKRKEIYNKLVEVMDKVNMRLDYESISIDEECFLQDMVDIISVEMLD